MVLRTHLQAEAAPLYLRAATAPETWDPERLTIELVASTGARVLRRPFLGEAFMEELGLKAGEVDLGRLQAGAPLLDSHRRFSIREGDVIGVVESATLLSNRELRVLVRFSDRDDLADVRRDVASGIIRNVSMGYRVRKFQDVTPDKDRRKILRAVDWEPFEVTLLAVGADAGAGVRSEALNDPALGTRAAELGPNACEILTTDPDSFTNSRAMQPTIEHLRSLAEFFGLDTAWATRQFEAGVTWEEANTRAAAEGTTPADGATPPAGPEPESSRNQPTPTPATPPTPDPAPEPSAGTRGQPDPAPVPVSPAAADAIRVEERARQRGIQDLRNRYELTEGWATRQIDGDVDLTEARTRALEMVAERHASEGGGNTHVSVLREAADGEAEAMESHLLVRCGYRDLDANGQLAMVEPSDRAREYRGMSLCGLASEYLRTRGIATRGLVDLEIAERALHGTSDFPKLLANVASKFLMRAYMESPRTFAALGTRRDLRDFKIGKVVQLGESPALEKINAQGEVRRGTVGEFSEDAALSSYGIMVGLSRQAMANDDLDGFSRLPRGFGASAAAQEGDLAWALITGNVVLGDGVALFASGHSNDVTGVLDASTGGGLDNGRTSMRKQTGVSSRTLNLQPRFLVVPAAQETAAQKAVATVNPNAPSGVNPFASAFQGVITEPRLDVNSAAKFYMTANPDQIDVLHYGYLEGFGPGPRVETRNGWNVDGMEIRCLHDFYVIVPDHRGWTRVSGA